MRPLFSKTIRNFLVANLCALLPLWMAVFGGTMEPVRMQFRVKGTKPVCLVTRGITLMGRNCGESRGCRVWGFFLRDGVEWENLEFILPANLGPEAVRRVELVKGRAFVLRKKGTGLVQTDAASNRYAFRDPGAGTLGFASRGWAAAFWGVELLLLLLSAGFAGRHRAERTKTLLLPVLGGALVLALLFQVILPLQSYLSNRSAFPFPLSGLGASMAVRFLAVWGAGTVCLLLLARCFGRWILAPVFAFSVCAYLEAGVLSIGLPDLKGDLTFFENPFRARWDAAVWAGVFAVFSGLHPLWKRHGGTVALCLSLLFAASLLDVKAEPRADASGLLVGDFSSLETVVRSAAYSSAGNVLVFVVDSLERGVAHAIMEDPEDGPALKEKFPGFTEYPENVGGYNSSLLGIANAFTGDYPEDAGIFDYFVSPYSDRSALKDYLEEGWNVAMATDALGYGYCTSPVDSADVPDRFDRFLVPGTAWNSWSLADFDRFRWFPFAAKAAFARSIEASVPLNVFKLSEERVYPILRDAEVLPSGRGAFLFVHTHGVHIPVTVDRTGAPLPRSRNDDQACVEMGIYVMKQLGALFDALREKGVYDNSMIVVMADHGPHVDDLDEELPPNARPFLWIKPAGARHAFRSSRLPTGHGQLAKVLRAAAKKVLTEEEIGELLQADVRRYRQLRAGTGPEYKDVFVDREGRVSIREGLLSRSVGEMRSPEPGKLYLLDREAMGLNKLDVVFRNVMFWPAPTLEAKMDGTSFYFRAPDPGKRYALYLVMSCDAPASGMAMKFRQAEHGSDWISVPVDWWIKAVLRDLEPGPDGKVEIEVLREADPPVPVLFRRLLLEEEPASMIGSISAAD